MRYQVGHQLRLLCSGALSDHFCLPPKRVILLGDSQAREPLAGWEPIPGYRFTFNTWGEEKTTDELTTLFKKHVDTTLLLDFDEIWIMAGSNDMGYAFSGLQLVEWVQTHRKSPSIPIWYFHNVFGASGKNTKAKCRIARVYTLGVVPVPMCVYVTPDVQPSLRRRETVDPSILTYTLQPIHTDESAHLTRDGIAYLVEFTKQHKHKMRSAQEEPGLEPPLEFS